jgi:hypothetical protein
MYTSATQVKYRERDAARLIIFFFFYDLKALKIRLFAQVCCPKKSTFALPKKPVGILAGFKYKTLFYNTWKRTYNH